MINISEIISSKGNFNKVLSNLFENHQKSKVNFVRLATHFNEISEAVEICKILKKKNLR